MNILEQKIEVKESNEQTITVPCIWQHQDGSTGCCAACKAIVEKAGAPWTFGLIQMVTEGAFHKSLSVNEKESILGLKAINYSLDTLKKPIVVGVNHTLDYKVTLKDGTENYPNWNVPDETTDHYVVIVGRGYDEVKGKKYYLFYDVAKNNIGICTSEENKLYLQTDGRICEEDTCIRERLISSDWHGKFYTVSVVLTNTK